MEYFRRKVSIGLSHHNLILYMNLLKKLFSGQSGKPESPESPQTAKTEVSSTNAASPEAATTIDERTEATDHDFETLRDDGIRAMRMGQFSFAEKCLLAALQRRDDDYAKSCLAEVYMAVQEGKKALSLLKELISRHADDIPLHLAAAHAAELCGEWSTVNDAGLAIERIDADNPNGIFYQAKAQHELKNDIACIALLTQLLTKHPEAREALRLRAQTLYSMQQYAEAEKDTDQLITTDQTDEDAFRLKGDVSRALGDDGAALRAYSHMRELNPFNRESVLLQAAVYIDRHQLDKAIQLLDEAIDLQPDFAEAYKQRGAVRRMLHDEAGAIDDLKKALELNPEEGKNMDGEYSNLEQRMNAEARLRNPFGF